MCNPCCVQCFVHSAPTLSKKNWSTGSRFGYGAEFFNSSHNDAPMVQICFPPTQPAGPQSGGSECSQLNVCYLYFIVLLLSRPAFLSHPLFANKMNVAPEHTTRRQIGFSGPDQTKRTETARRHKGIKLMSVRANNFFTPHPSPGLR